MLRISVHSNDYSTNDLMNMTIEICEKKWSLQLHAFYNIEIVQ